MMAETEAEVRPTLWQDFAECRLNPHINFYPDQDDLRAVLRAKKVCRECMVRDECLEEAIVKREFGVWGGTTERDRARMIVNRRNGEGNR